jgi:Family of unknown function (DUF6298)
MFGISPPRALVAAWLMLLCGCSSGDPIELQPAPAVELLHVSARNPRYFETASGAIVVLSGSHTWSNFQDNGHGDPPPVFDYPRYLDFVANHGHNFFRLYVWENSRWTLQSPDEDYWFFPAAPYQRTGPGMALDGKPKFDLTRFDPAYFERLRARVQAAGARGIYVAVMLFDGWAVAGAKGSHHDRNPWHGHPFNAANNINGIDGDTNHDDSGTESHELAVHAVTAIQEAYVRQVIDSVNDLDNVLYEISNESEVASTAWQYHIIDFIKRYEKSKGRSHPVGMTVQYPDGKNSTLLESPADWISPNGDLDDPPVATGAKVIVADTDHLCGICGNRQWAWKSFTRGENPIFMDGYDGSAYGVGGAGFEFNEPKWISLRDNLGYILSTARRFDLHTMRPEPGLASTHYCLADPARGDFIIYLPPAASSPGVVEVDLGRTRGALSVEWLDPARGHMFKAEPISGGKKVSLTAPFDGDAVLLLRPAVPAGQAAAPGSGG